MPEQDSTTLPPVEREGRGPQVVGFFWAKLVRKLVIKRGKSQVDRNKSREGWNFFEKLLNFFAAFGRQGHFFAAYSLKAAVFGELTYFMPFFYHFLCANLAETNISPKFSVKILKSYAKMGILWLDCEQHAISQNKTTCGFLKYDRGPGEKVGNYWLACSKMPCLACVRVRKMFVNHLGKKMFASSTPAAIFLSASEVFLSNEKLVWSFLNCMRPNELLLTYLENGSNSILKTGLTLFSKLLLLSRAPISLPNFSSMPPKKPQK